MTDSRNPPRISVVIPAYNAAGFVSSAIESAWSQTLQPHEVIVVDDGSRDDTAAVVQSRDGHRVKLISQPNGGPASARNHGIREATGDWIAFLDSDDSWKPEKLERQSAYISDEVGLIHCFIDADSVCNHPQVTVDFEALWQRNYVGTSTVLMRKSAWEQVGGFDDDRALVGAEDYNLWLKIAGANWRIATLREGLSYYTPAPDSIMTQILQVVRAELLNVDRIAARFKIPQEMVQKKKVAIWDEYARTLLWMRNKPEARKLFGNILRTKPSAAALLHWMATFVPDAILNWKRNLKSNVVS